MTSTQNPELTHHQRSLQTATEAFITSIKLEDHDMQRYKMYVKDVKLILDKHVAELMGRNTSDVAKQVLKTVNDPECRYLRPTESSTESSDEDFPTTCAHPVEDQIFGEFLENLLTPEIREHITAFCENMEQVHLLAVTTMEEMAKLSPELPRGPFHLHLQAMVQPVIKMCG